MKSVVLKSSIVLLFIFLFSCHKTILNSKKNEITVAKAKVNKADSIITDSNDPNFIYDLIMTQKVSIGDTVLFREWSGLAKKTITIYSDKIGFRMFTDTISKFYKTGEIKFSKNEITVLNTLSNKYFKINAFAIIDNDLDDAYDMNRPTSYLTLKKLSKTLGVFDFSSPMYGEYLMAFNIKNDAVHITKIANQTHSAGQFYKYELDTLIVLRNNDRIYPDSLRSTVCKEKNRIPVKETKRWRSIDLSK
jgi:hypothetical protein